MTHHNKTPGRILYDEMYASESGDVEPFCDAPSGIREACDKWAKAAGALNSSDIALVLAALDFYADNFEEWGDSEGGEPYSALAKRLRQHA